MLLKIFFYLIKVWIFYFNTSIVTKLKNILINKLTHQKKINLKYKLMVIQDFMKIFLIQLKIKS